MDGMVNSIRQLVHLQCPTFILVVNSARQLISSTRFVNSGTRELTNGVKVPSSRAELTTQSCTLEMHELTNPVDDPIRSPFLLDVAPELTPQKNIR